MKQAEREKGEASIFIELKDSKIKVFHGTDKVLLYQRKVKEGYWNKLWEIIKQ